MLHLAGLTQHALSVHTSLLLAKTHKVGGEIKNVSNPKQCKTRWTEYKLSTNNAWRSQKQ